MFLVDGTDIYIHRGDSAVLDVVFGDVEPENSENAISIKEVYGIDWIPEDGTPIRFTVKCDTGRQKAVIQKDYYVYNGFCCFDFLPKDTWCLPPNEYVWDVRISFPNAGVMEWNTPFNPCKFTVCEVVSDVLQNASE